MALPNLMFVAYATANRVTRSGKAQGPEQRTTPLEAMKAITLWGARQDFEEASKGSITVGKLADLVVLSGDPVGGDPSKMKGIVVLESIKEGKTVYTRK